MGKGASKLTTLTKASKMGKAASKLTTLTKAKKAKATAGGQGAIDMEDEWANLDMVYYLFRSYLAGAHGMFRQLDTDKDGLITEEELRAIMTEDMKVPSILYDH